MAANTNTLTPLALEGVALLESKSKYLAKEFGKRGIIKIATNIKLEFNTEEKKDDDSIGAVYSYLKIDLKGTITANEITEDYFEMYLEYFGKFKAKEGYTLSDEELNNNPNIACYMLFPIARGHIIEILTKMNISASNVPWHFDLPPLRKTELENES